MRFLRVNSVVILNLAVILLAITELSTAKDFHSSKSKHVVSAAESKEQNFENCWSEANFTCIKSMILDPFKDIWKKKEIRLMDSVVIEKIANVSTDDYEMTKVKSKQGEGRGQSSEGDQLVENVGRFLKSHALRVDLGSFATIRMERSQENPDNLEIVFDMNRGESTDGEAKGNRMWKIIVPLVMGFKTTGALIFAISAVKLFLLKALMVSKLALLAAGFLVMRRVMSSMGAQHHPYLYAHQSMPYFHDHGMDSGLSSGYGYSNYMAAGGLGGHYATPSGHGAAQAYGASAAGGEDLQAHFSNNVITAIQAGAANQTTARKDGLQRRLFSLVKSDLNRVPVLTYRKLVDTGRSS
ncbi:uncharacterized protein [Periplaneta americana]|uniref:uncharacterized protein n=1 Tax=Periplaneta americana TaxID=6978 RepID=UPI0037E7152E